MRFLAAFKTSVLACAVTFMCSSGQVDAKMGQSPLQVTINRETMSDIYNSAGVDVLRVFDNILIDEFKSDGVSISNLKLTSADQSQETKDKFFMAHKFDSDKNTITIESDEIGAASPWIQGTVTINKGNVEEQAKVRLQVTAASATCDLQFYREMPAKQLEQLRAIKLAPVDTKVLAPQIAATKVEFGKGSLKIEGGELAAALSNDDVAMSALSKHIEAGVLSVIDTRVAMFNEPHEIIQDMQADYFSIDAIEQLVEDLMVKLGFRLPNKLIAPVTFYAACNFLAKEINVSKDNVMIQFDPRNVGLINENVQTLLQNIEHPTKDDGSHAYSVSLDQNLINSAIIQAGNVQKELSIRKMINMFDKRADFISKLDTSQMAFEMAMPSLKTGRPRQFDIVTTFDQAKFMETNRKSLISGFDIDSKGFIKGTVNLLSFMKLAPEGLEGPKNEKDKEGRNRFSNSADWEIARTIYTSLTLYGRVQINKEDDNNSVLQAALTGFEISKLDFFKGDMTKQQVQSEDKEEAEEEYDEDDDDDDDETSELKTLEGDLISSILNIQLKQYLTQFLPKVERRFSNDLRRVDFFDCYGMHLRVPEINYFTGGFEVVGNYKKVPVVNAACLQTETGLNDIVTSHFTPKMLRQKVEILIRLFEKLNGKEDFDIMEIIKEISRSSESLTSMPIDKLIVDKLPKNNMHVDSVMKFVGNNIDLGEMAGVLPTFVDLVSNKDKVEKKINAAINSYQAKVKEDL